MCPRSAAFQRAATKPSTDTRPKKNDEDGGRDDVDVFEHA